MAYKVIYNRKECIGANSCVGVLPEFWSLDGDKKAVLKGSHLNLDSERYELIIEEKDLERFKESALVCPVNVIDIVDTNTQKSVLGLLDTGEVEKESAPVIQARSRSAAETREDPKGFFKIRIVPENSLIKAHYYGTKHQLLFIIEGKNAEAIYSTIIREGFVSSLTYTAYLASELQKAEFALKKNLPYHQDQPMD